MSLIRLRRLLACLVMIALLQALPATCAAALFSDELAALSDAELLRLHQLVTAEVEARGLSADGSSVQASDGPLVWIPKSGSKYHSKSTCSNMKNPVQVTLAEAKDGGYGPCKKCRPPV